MKHQNLVFLRPYSLKNLSPEKQMLFHANEIGAVEDCAHLGKIYSNDAYAGQDIATFIHQEVEKHKPEWVIAEGECATIALKIHGQKKILINPRITESDLENVSEREAEITIGIFDSAHEHDYDLFQSAYPKATLDIIDDSTSVAMKIELIEEFMNEQ